MKQVTLRWYDAYAVYSVLRDPDKEANNNNYYASAHNTYWSVWEDGAWGDRSIIAGARMRYARGNSTCIEASKLAASREVVRQLRAAGVKAVVRKAGNGC